jgi:hypothetical protein
MTVKPVADFLSLSAIERKAAVDRIIVAVGRQPDDQEALAHDIDKAALTFYEMEAFARMRQKGSRKVLASTQKTWGRISKLIGSDPLLATTADELKKRLRNFEEWHRAHDRKPVKRGSDIGKKDRPSTVIEWLCGVTLRKVFERRFNLPFKFNWTPVKGDPEGRVEPGGPPIDFIEAVLKEFGVRYTRQSIGSAIVHTRRDGQI